MATAPYFDNTQLCAQTDPELFFPEVKGKKNPDYLETVKKAKAICGHCHFKDPCLEYALKHDIVGIWGGTEQAERDKLRSKAGVAKPKSLSLLNDKLIKQKSAR
jgi:WhiB family redox-sensing transcriptional regulator